MNIAFINTGKMHGIVGGIEKVYCDLANILSKRGHSITCFHCDTSNGSLPFFISPNIKIINISNQPSRIPEWKILRKILSWNINREKRRNKRALIEAQFLAYKFNAALSLANFDAYLSFRPEATLMLREAFLLRKTTKKGGGADHHFNDS